MSKNYTAHARTVSVGHKRPNLSRAAELFVMVRASLKRSCSRPQNSHPSATASAPFSHGAPAIFSAAGPPAAPTPRPGSANSPPPAPPTPGRPAPPQRFTWRRYEKAPARRRTGAKLATTLKIREISGETTRMLYSARELVGGQMNLR